MGKETDNVVETDFDDNVKSDLVVVLVACGGKQLVNHLASPLASQKDRSMMCFSQIIMLIL